MNHSVIIFFWVLSTSLFASNVKGSAIIWERIEMESRIKERIKNQLGVEKVKSLGHYDIEGWPLFVQFKRQFWDAQALQDLKAALDRLVFKEKQTVETTVTGTQGVKRINERKQELFRLLLDRFRDYTGHYTSSKIKWSMFHVKGWPSGVSFLSTAWSNTDLLAVYHHLNDITWEPVMEGEERTITYTDGTIERFTRHIRKRSSKKSCQRNELVDETLENLNERKKEMVNRILQLAKDQLNSDSIVSLKCLETNFEVEGWPDFVSFRMYCWDEQALADLEASMNSLVFREKQQKTAQSESQPLIKIIHRRKLLYMLLEKFRIQIGDASAMNIQWENYHVKGWPPGVSRMSKEWSAADILAIYHHLKGITWERVKRGEKRTVVYSDGSVEMLSSKRAKNHPDDPEEDSFAHYDKISWRPHYFNGELYMVPYSEGTNKYTTVNNYPKNSNFDDADHVDEDTFNECLDDLIRDLESKGC